MSDRTSYEDELASLIASCDEALAAGAKLPDAGGAGSPAAISPHVRNALEGIERLERHWPRRRLRPDDTHLEESNGGLPPRIGRFEIRREIGCGSFGQVFLAYDPQLARDVALKVPRAHALATPELRDRFRREAQAAAGLEHANIVQVHEAGTAGSISYIASAYCPGPTLAAWLKEQKKPVSAEFAAELVANLADGVQHAHDRGVLHRDLKPGNILLQKVDSSQHSVVSRPHMPNSTDYCLLTTDYFPKITDFGLAKVRADVDGYATQSGAILGTPQYMAPEQASGKSPTIAETADIYALGAILYELLAGRPPFMADSVLEMLTQVKSAEPVSPRRLRPKLPRDLETICLKCLQKEPGKRCARAGDLAADLRRFVKGEPIRARPVGAMERGWRWCRRNPVIAMLTSVAAALLLVGTVVSTYFAFREAERAEEAEMARQTSDQLRYISDMQLAQRLAEEKRHHPLNAILDSYLPERNRGEDLRGFEWYYWRSRHNVGRLLTDHGSEVEWIVFSPDGTRIATASHDGIARIFDSVSGEEVSQLFGHGHRACVVTFSPNGRLVATAAHDGTARIWDAPTGKELRVISGHAKKVLSVAFNADGTRLATGSEDKTARVWDVESGRELISIKAHKSSVSGVSFGPDGRVLATASFDGTVCLWDADTGSQVHQLTAHPNNWAYSAIFSPDGHRLATTSNDKTARLWDVQSGEELLVLAHADRVETACFSPDGQRLLTACGDHTARLWDVTNGRELAVFSGHTAGLASVAISPNGRYAATASYDRTARLWELADQTDPRILTGHNHFIYGLDFSPDCHFLASASADKTVRIWNIFGGTEALLLNHDQTVLKVAFSPDGRRIAGCSVDGTARLWSVDNGSEISVLNGHKGAVKSVIFSPDGRRIATTGDDGAARVWDAESGKELLVLKEGHAGYVSDVAYSPDGRHLATVCWDRRVRLWDATTGRRLKEFLGHSEDVGGVRFSPCGRKLASCSFDQTARIWDRDSGQELAVCRGHTSILNSLRFSPDGRRLATTSHDGTARLWDVRSGRELLVLKGHTGVVCGVAFSPDGRCIATGGEDKIVRLWDTVPLSRPAR